MSTLSSVTDGQLCDEGTTPGCPPKVVVQDNSSQTVVAPTTTRVVADSRQTATVTLRQSSPIVVSGSPAPAVVVSSASQRVLATGGQQGVQGVQGLPGPAGGVSELRVASEDLGGHRIVRSTGAGTAGYASSDNALHGDDTLGMTLGAVVSGGTVSVLRVGPVTHAGWAWAAGEPVFLGTNGVPTQTTPVVGFSQIIGHAEDATTLFLSIEQPVYF